MSERHQSNIDYVVDDGEGSAADNDNDNVWYSGIVDSGCGINNIESLSRASASTPPHDHAHAHAQFASPSIHDSGNGVINLDDDSVGQESVPSVCPSEATQGTQGSNGSGISAIASAVLAKLVSEDIAEGTNEYLQQISQDLSHLSESPSANQSANPLVRMISQGTDLAPVEEADESVQTSEMQLQRAQMEIEDGLHDIGNDSGDDASEVSSDGGMSEDSEVEEGDAITTMSAKTSNTTARSQKEPAFLAFFAAVFVFLLIGLAGGIHRRNTAKVVSSALQSGSIDMVDVDAVVEAPVTAKPTNVTPASVSSPNAAPTTAETTTNEPTIPTPSLRSKSSKAPVAAIPLLIETPTPPALIDEQEVATTAAAAAADELVSHDILNTPKSASSAPVSREPTPSPSPASGKPTTYEPTSFEPTTDTPTTDEPTSNKPTTGTPTTVTDESMSSAPTDIPITSIPSSRSISSEEPTKDSLATATATEDLVR